MLFSAVRGREGHGVVIELQQKNRFGTGFSLVPFTGKRRPRIPWFRRFRAVRHDAAPLIIRDGFPSLRRRSTFAPRNPRLRAGLTWAAPRRRRIAPLIVHKQNRRVRRIHAFPHNRCESFPRRLKPTYNGIPCGDGYFWAMMGYALGANPSNPAFFHILSLWERGTGKCDVFIIS